MLRKVTGERNCRWVRNWLSGRRATTKIGEVKGHSFSMKRGGDARLRAFHIADVTRGFGTRIYSLTDLPANRPPEDYVLDKAFSSFMLPAEGFIRGISCSQAGLELCEEP
jgi:hypothetical protein